MATMDDELKQQLDQALAHGTSLPSGVRINFGDPEPFQALGDSDQSRGVADETPDLLKMTRDELNAYASEQGVENPGALSNKDAVIAAIEDQ
jgi:hypothetical protein